MTFLILAILMSTLVSVVMRLSEGRVQSGMCMLAGNYITCSGVAALLTFTAGRFHGGEGLPFALGFGAVSGAFYLASFMLLHWNIAVNGVVLPSTFMKLGVLVPTVMSMLLFGEQPGAMQITGIVLAVAAIVLIRTEGTKGIVRSGMGLAALLLIGGLTDGLSKIYEEKGAADLSGLWLMVTFLSALVLSAVVCLIRRERPASGDIPFGLLLGIPNYFSARFLLMSLHTVPAVAAYPTFSVGTIVLVTLTGTLLFHERLSRRQWIAVGLILAALVLLNI